MGESSDSTRVLDATLNALRARPGTFFCAIAEDGFLVRMPASVQVTAERVIPLPVDRATLLDLVVAPDRMAVVTTWERARRSGMAIAVVRLAEDPGTPMTLTFLDVRATHGVWMGVLGRGEPRDVTSGDGAVAGALAVPRRPRTATITKSMFAMVRSVDERTTRMLGWTADEMVGVRSLDFIHQDDHERALSNWMEMLSRREPQRVRYRHRCRDGAWLWVEVEHVYEHADDPDDVVVTAQLSDISDEMAAHEAVHRRERLFHRLAESLPTGVMQVEADGSIVYANERLETILGTGGVRRLSDQLVNVLPHDRPSVDAACAAALDHGLDQEVEASVRLPVIGEVRRCRLTLRSLADEDRSAGALICVSDVTDSARMREELRLRATFDALSGCYNRASVIAALDDALVTNAPGAVAAIFVDLDKFKSVNDHLGHTAGDELLTHAAGVIKRVLRADDIVGRLGGDEFLVLCQRLERPEEALGIAERIADSLRSRVALAGGAVDLSASVGIAFSDAGSTTEVLVARADAAMYESKRRGAGRPVADAA